MAGLLYPHLAGLCHSVARQKAAITQGKNILSGKAHTLKIYVWYTDNMGIMITHYKLKPVIFGVRLMAAILLSIAEAVIYPSAVMPSSVILWEVKGE